MLKRGGIRLRLALAIVVTALIPMLAALWLVEATVRQASQRFFVPEIGTRLDAALGLYQELARSVKQGMRHQALGLAREPALVEALRAGDRDRVDASLRRLVQSHPGVVSLRVVPNDGSAWARADRAERFDPEREHQLEVALDLEEGVAAPLAGGQFVAHLATDQSRFAGLGDMSQFVDSYRQIEQRRRADEEAYVLAFGALLSLTILAAIAVGVLAARGVSRRVLTLAQATRKVGQGDLSIRVPVAGSDELGDLARAFNRMLEEISRNRSRIEYLQRIGAWQEMARRLAHEIKNPLTPIQLAVQDMHQRYRGSDSEYRKLVDTTLEIVEDEVGTLRRLVSEFSDFARLPQAKLEEHDLRAFLEEQKERWARTNGGAPASSQMSDDWLGAEGVELDFELPPDPVVIRIDRQMLRRALLNLVRNAHQAIAAAEPSAPGESRDAPRSRVLVRLHRDAESWILDVEDSGPGIAAEDRETVFDPYRTTKADGTGLGLAIVKKIVIEHGGTVVADQSPLGGARMRLRFPFPTPEGTAEP